MTISAPVPQMGTLSPKIETWDGISMILAGRRGAFELWEVNVDLGVVSTGSVTVEILEMDGEIVDFCIFD
jgi:hypothetical protein